MKNWDLQIAPSFAGNTSVACKPTAADSHILALVNFVAFLPLEEEAKVVMGASEKVESSFLAAQLHAAEDYSLLKEEYCSVSIRCFQEECFVLVRTVAAVVECSKVFQEYYFVVADDRRFLRDYRIVGKVLRLHLNSEDKIVST